MHCFATWGAQHATASMSDEELARVHPMFLYGDDCKYSHQEKLTCVSCAFVLDERSSSMKTHLPVFIVREVSWLPFEKPHGTSGLVWALDTD